MRPATSTGVVVMLVVFLQASSLLLGLEPWRKASPLLLGNAVPKAPTKLGSLICKSRTMLERRECARKETIEPQRVRVVLIRESATVSEDAIVDLTSALLHLWVLLHVAEPRRLWPGSRGGGVGPEPPSSAIATSAAPGAVAAGGAVVRAGSQKTGSTHDREEESEP